jgi:hypothetical protein
MAQPCIVPFPLSQVNDNKNNKTSSRIHNSEFHIFDKFWGGFFMLFLGTGWEYGTSLDWVGLVIEKVSGLTLGAYMQQHIFDPLGINSTTFAPSEEHAARRAQIHFRASNKQLSEIDAKTVFGETVVVHLGGSM